MPNARPWRTSRSSSRLAACESWSSSTKNSWNSSIISRMRGSLSFGRALRKPRMSCTPTLRNSSPRSLRMPSSRSSTLMPNSRSLSMPMIRAWGIAWLAYVLNSTPFLKSTR